MPQIPFRRPIPSIVPYGQPVMADDKVRYVGEPVAVVLADSPEIAEDARELIDVEIDPLPAVVDARAAKASDGHPVRAAPRATCAAIFTGAKGDCAAALEERALRACSEPFQTQRQTALPMETRGLLAEWDESGRQAHGVGRGQAAVLQPARDGQGDGPAEAQVDYIEYDVGGGFGARGEFYPEDPGRLRGAQASSIRSSGSRTGAST